MLKNGNRGDVGEPLCNGYVVVAQRALKRAEKIKGADSPAAKTHGQTVHGSETYSEGSRRKIWPSIVRVGKRVINYRVAISKTVNAGTFIRLNLKEFQNSHCLTRRSNVLQLPPG